MLEAYRQHTADRAALGIPPLPLDAEQTSALCELLQHPPAGEEANLIALLRDQSSTWSRSGCLCQSWLPD